MLPLLALVTGALGASAAFLPHPAQDEGILSESVETAAPVWNCSVRTWVRAPDLEPDIRVRADARVIAEGSDCSEIRQMGFGLRMAERSIYKFRAPGVDLPERPQMDYSSQESRQHNDSVFRVDTWGPSSWGLPPAQQAFELKQTEYAKTMEDPALWIAAGVERQVFDSAMTHMSFDKNNRIPKETLASFEVVVPKTNFPPVLRDNSGRSDASEVASSESLFEYYVSLTLSNGTVLSYPSGRTGFLPWAANENGERQEGMRTLHLPIRNSRRDRDAAHASGSSSRPAIHHWSDGPWDYQETPSCDAGNLAEFKVDVVVPEKMTFFPGQHLSLNVTVSRIGNGTEIPTQVAIMAGGCQKTHWAAQFAHTEALKNLTEYCAMPRYYGPGDTSELLALSPFNRTRYAESLENRRKECLDRGLGGCYSYMGYSDWNGGRSPSKLDPSLAVQSVFVNFTIPLGAVPNFNATYVHFMNRIEVALRTEFTCDNPDGSGPLTEARTERESDLLWEGISYYHECPQSGSMRPSFRSSATFPIIVRSPKAGNAQHYGDETALAPAIVPLAFPGSIDFKTVSVRTMAETSADQLVQRKYAPWLRMPPRGCSNVNDAMCGRGGGENAHAAEAWRHAELKEELDRIKLELEEKWAREG